MAKRVTAVMPGQAALLDRIKRDNSIKSDSQLARELEVDGTLICSVRSGRSPFSAFLILAIHEYFGMPVADIREALAA